MTLHCRYCGSPNARRVEWPEGLNAAPTGTCPDCDCDFLLVEPSAPALTLRGHLFVLPPCPFPPRAGMAAMLPAVPDGLVLEQEGKRVVAWRVE